MNRRIRLNQQNLTLDDINFLMGKEYRRHLNALKRIQRKCPHQWVDASIVTYGYHKEKECRVCGKKTGLIKLEIN